jgi:5'-deoxynucleotidase YfbR-like HD superfamily hydrolase
MKKTVNLLQVLDNLSRMPRTGGIMFAGIDPQLTDSLADHSNMVANLALILGNAAKQRNFSINMEKLLTAAITHDWNETILLDIPSGSPSYRSYFNIVNLREVVKEAEQNANQAIEEYISEDVKLEISDIALSNEEKNLLIASDIIALLLEILDWKYNGLRYEWFDFLWANTVHRLRDTVSEFHFMNTLIAELEDSFEKGLKPANPFLTKGQFQHLKK